MCVTYEASRLGGWADDARRAREARERMRGSRARAQAIGDARRRAATASDMDVADADVLVEVAPREAGWKRGRRVLAEAGKRARRRRRGEVELRVVRRVAEESESESD